MNMLKFLWGFLFRLFPCPMKTGLIRIGNPDRNSPVLVTCNFYITVERLKDVLKGLDLWLLVGESKGVNVWCAAGGDEFSTQSVVSVVKTSGIADEVDHRKLILPPLGAPGIKSKDVKDQTGWSVKWGPVRMEDIPRYLAQNQKRDEKMATATYTLTERLDTGLGSLFPFYFLGAIGFIIFGRHLLLSYLLVGAATFLFFMITCPWLPGRSGLAKIAGINAILGVLLIVTEVMNIPATFSIRAELIIAMVTLLIYGTELGGLSSTMPSDLDPFLAKLGIGAVGNVALAGTIRTELINEFRILTYYRDKCIGCRTCVEVCPQRVWEFDDDKRAVMAHKEKCTACKACIFNCRSGAIKAEPK